MNVELPPENPRRNRVGRPSLSIEEKLRRGTFRAGRELKKLERASKGLSPELPKPVAEVKARSYAAILDAYCTGVLSGSIVACAYVRQAVSRHLTDLDRADEGWDYVWDQAEANRACHFVEQIPHVEESWATPTLVLEPWQVFLVSLLYGWRLKANPDKRRFTTVYLEVGRKSAKSTLMAALAYYHLLAERGVVGASVICGATTGQQARMVFGIMQAQGRRSLWLAKQGVQVLANSILCPNGSAKPVNAKASSLDGLNPSMIILDESHAQNYGLHDVLISGQGGRNNPLLVCPTTAGYDLLSVGYALHQQVEKLLGGVFEADHVLGVIYTLDKGDDWRDERMWIKANPMIGISPKLDYMRRYCQDVQQVPGKQGEFRVKACSQWMQGSSRWIDTDAWTRCADPSLRLEDFAGQKCWIGADLAAVDDLAAVALVFERGDELVVFCRAYLPDGVIEERSRLVPQYRVWREDYAPASGLPELIGTGGTMIDFDAIEAGIRKDCAQFAVQAIVFDQFGSTQICGRLAAEGFPATVLPKRADKVTPAAMDFEARVNRGKLRHTGSSLLTWAVLNAAVTRRVDDSLLPKKDGAESANKIDPLDAILQAMAARLSAQKPPPRHQLLILGGARRT